MRNQEKARTSFVSWGDKYSLARQAFDRFRKAEEHYALHLRRRQTSPSPSRGGPSPRASPSSPSSPIVSASVLKHKHTLASQLSSLSLFSPISGEDLTFFEADEEEGGVHLRSSLLHQSPGKPPFVFCRRAPGEVEGREGGAICPHPSCVASHSHYVSLFVLLLTPDCRQQV